MYANIELCRELEKLSGWKDTDWYYAEDGSSLKYWRPDNEVPAYSVGYLLRKLPGGIAINENAQRNEGRNWIAYQIDTDYRDNQYADTPEDAAALLAIELHKQGIL